MPMHALALLLDSGLFETSPIHDRTNVNSIVVVSVSHASRIVLYSRSDRVSQVAARDVLVTATPPFARGGRRRALGARSVVGGHGSARLRFVRHVNPVIIAAGFLASIGAGSPIYAQHVAAVDSASLTPRSVRALRIVGPAPRLDGNLNDPVWARAFSSAATTASDFIQSVPHPGSIPALRTVAAFAFDNDALYVAVRAFDPAPDSIIAPYLRRDNEARSDWLFVELDTRHDRRTAFSFGCNPGGTLVDGTFSKDTDYDVSWNGVWECAARIDSLGWTAEYRIPFSQLRAAAPVHGEAEVVWGMNVYRYAVHRGEVDNWSPRLPSYGGRVVSHFNELRGIELPRARHPFELRPFVLARSQANPLVAPGPLRSDQRVGSAAGADVTARLARGVTIDAAIRPDFGQVEADPSQINLTTFETFLQERRPFFVNGADAFQFNLGIPFATRGDDFSRDQAFYSRRVGAPPHGAAPSWATLSDVPSASDVLGAAKLTGRVAGGWTLGGLVAATRSEDATYLDTLGRVARSPVEPRTGFGALRLQRDFRNGATAIGALATAVERSDLQGGLDSILARHAMFLGMDGRHRVGNYELTGFTGVSQVTGDPRAITRVLHGPGHFLQRPDASYVHDDTTAAAATGAAARLGFARISGGNLSWSMTGYAVTPRFDVDDEGFQRNSDWLLALGTIRYQRNNTAGLFRRWAVASDKIGAGWSFGGERRTTVANIRFEGDLWNYWGGSLSVDQELSDISLDLLRGGASVVVPARTTASLNLYSDNRRATQVQLNAQAYREPGTGSRYLDVAPSITSRLSSRLALTGSFELSSSTDGWHYLARVVPPDGQPSTILARLRSSTASVTARADYAFTPKLTLQGYLQPYLGAGRYDRPDYAQSLGGRASIVPLGKRAQRTANGSLAVDFDDDGQIDARVPNADFNVRELHGSAVLRWEYRPGSELFLVWTQTRSGYDNLGSLAPRRDVGDLFRVAPSNVVLAKLSYYWQP